MDSKDIKTKMADEETQKICKKVKKAIQLKAANYVNFKAIPYWSQVVAGTNYFIKVNMGGSDYIHIAVMEELPCYGGKCIFAGVQEGKTLDDQIEYFPPK